MALGDIEVSDGAFISKVLLALKPLVEDSDADVRKAATKSLEKIGNQMVNMRRPSWLDRFLRSRQ